MPHYDHYVIIGNGPAGNHTAAILRENDGDAKITIISDENIFFYYKPKLTEYIAGGLTKAELMVPGLSFYREKKIRLRLGQKVDKIDPERKIVFLNHMEKIYYTKLVIASGSGARVLPSMRSYADCLKHITTYNQVMEYKEQIQTAGEFFIFGGDLVGFKFIKMLCKMHKQVTLLIYPNAFWPFNLTEKMQEIIVKNLSRQGADVLVNDDISQIIKKEDTYIVKTVKGVEQQVDLVFSFNGLIPSVEFAKGCGLDIDHGILVNETMQTNVPDIYACGSCAQIYNPKINSYTTSIGWANAVVQGKVTAMNLLGTHRVIESVDYKYFDLEGVEIKTTWWEDIEESSFI
ncbi:MAG: FAD-dependent oxidoreductase [Desulfobacteraceae bacterium]|nr:FAD-dependent oxidoreductase [Desulfobacteraceae bacterium]